MEKNIYIKENNTYKYNYNMIYGKISTQTPVLQLLLTYFIWQGDILYGVKQ